MLEQRYAGSFVALVTDAATSAAGLVRILIEMPLYRDISRYEDFQVPFLKRAQISVADLALVETPKGRYLSAHRVVAGEDAASLLPGLVVACSRSSGSRAAP